MNLHDLPDIGPVPRFPFDADANYVRWAKEYALRCIEQRLGQVPVAWYDSETEHIHLLGDGDLPPAGRTVVPLYDAPAPVGAARTTTFSRAAA